MGRLRAAVRRTARRLVLVGAIMTLVASAAALFAGDLTFRGLTADVYVWGGLIVTLAGLGLAFADRVTEGTMARPAIVATVLGALGFAIGSASGGLLGWLMLGVVLLTAFAVGIAAPWVGTLVAYVAGGLLGTTLIVLLRSPSNTTLNLGNELASSVYVALLCLMVGGAGMVGRRMKDRSEAKPDSVRGSPPS